MMPEYSDLAQSLRKCNIQANVLHLPPIADGALTNYQEIRKALLNAGAKYRRNKFIFPSAAQPFVDRLCAGEVVNLRKEFQFFPTPAAIADWLVDLAEIQTGHRILEPSAGQGAIINAIISKFPKMKIECFELMPENAAILNSHPSITLIGRYFLSSGIDVAEGFDRIVANPPFSKNQDIDHIYQMYDILRKGGRLVSVASKHWQLSQNKKEAHFRKWLKETNAKILHIESGKFKESGTMVGCSIVVIKR